MTAENKNFIAFSNTFCLKNLVNELNCFKTATASCIALILTIKNRVSSNQEPLKVAYQIFLKLQRPQFEKLSKGNPKTRSSPSEVFLGKGVLKICSNITGEHPCRSVISIKMVKHTQTIRKTASVKLFFVGTI